MAQLPDDGFLDSLSPEKRRLAPIDGDALDPLDVDSRKTHRFNFMVVGPNGTGKSTFCERLLKRYFVDYELQRVDGPTQAIKEYALKEKQQGNDTIKIGVVDTPGYGDIMNIEDRFRPIEEYLERQHQYYEDNEIYRHESNGDDTRIHCCFYFFSPHRVTLVDKEFLTRLHDKVNIVPVISKADTLSVEERKRQLYDIHRFVRDENIRIFDFREEIDESWLEQYPQQGTVDGQQFDFAGVAAHIVPPAAAAASSSPSTTGPVAQVVQAQPAAGDPGAELQSVRNVFAVISGVRDYPWGAAVESNASHCDTERLHNILSGGNHHLARLLTNTNTLHEAWRKANRSRWYSPAAWLKQMKPASRARVSAWQHWFKAWSAHIALAMGLCLGLCLCALVARGLTARHEQRLQSNVAAWNKTLANLSDSLARSEVERTELLDLLTESEAERVQLSDSITTIAAERVQLSDSLTAIAAERAELSDSLVRSEAERTQLSDSLEENKGDLERLLARHNETAVTVDTLQQSCAVKIDKMQQAHARVLARTNATCAGELDKAQQAMDDALARTKATCAGELAKTTASYTEKLDEVRQANVTCTVELRRARRAHTNCAKQLGLAQSANVTCTAKLNDAHEAAGSSVWLGLVALLAVLAVVFLANGPGKIA